MGARLGVETSAAAVGAVVLTGSHPTVFSGALEAALATAAGGSGGLAAVMAAPAGACLGLRFHDGYPARIFLGDRGSLFLGFTLASAMVVLHDDAADSRDPSALCSPPWSRRRTRRS
ncbi:hypothetical protein ABT215_26765 [Streptomyces sp900105755]|uniref:hypothetical protein n=1 Tax=Streptomyces sp. 900105755 TaxID=3154389 RepID=UPI00331C9F0A